MNTHVQTEKLQEIADGVLTAWQTHHGTVTGTAHAVSGSSSLFVIIENAFSPAERHLMEQEGKHTEYVSYVESLLAHICQEQTAVLRETANLDIVSAGANMNPIDGWVLCFFRLGSGQSQKLQDGWLSTS